MGETYERMRRGEEKGVKRGTAAEEVVATMEEEVTTTEEVATTMEETIRHSEACGVLHLSR